MLTEDEIATADHVFQAKEAGFYELSELYGDQWQFERRPRWFGVRFRRSVLAGALDRVRWARRKSNRHQLYEVLG